MAKTWLMGTFLFVRLKKNPDHYRRLDMGRVEDINQILENICSRAIDLLLEYNVVTLDGEILRITDFGKAIAHFYIHFETAKVFLTLPERAKLSELVRSIGQQDSMC